MKEHKFWKQVGKNEKGEAIFENLKTKERAVEKDFMYLVEEVK